MSTLVEVNNLVYEYPTKRALENVSFSIESGSVVALVGPNGAGKTTLLRCLAALEPPFSGQVFIDEIDTQTNPRRCHRLIGYLTDFYGLYDDLTVIQCLSYMGAIHQVPADEFDSSLSQVIKDLNLEEYKHTRASALSRGLRQRLAIAQALIHKPKLLFLDEPAAGLDPQARFALSKLIKKLNSQGITIIVSSHILSELEDYSTHMLTMDHGKIRGFQAIGQIKFSQTGGKLVQISFLETKENTIQIVESFSGLKIVQTAGLDYFVELNGDNEAQHSLLKYLLENNLRVSSIAEVKKSLQEVYLSQLDVPEKPKT